MQWLRMLGTIDLTDSDGAEVDALLRQPKSVALLAYLAVPRPGTWHRRDLLLATFWPDLSQSRARAALRSALHLLRRHLEDGTIRTRGDDEVALDPERLMTDVAMMLDDVAAQERARALAYYRGPLLPGLYISEAPEFERWLEIERARLNDTAVRTAASLVTERESAGDLAAAANAARYASELSPDDEGAARRWITLLDQVGDRAQALAAFERLRNRMAEEFGTEPSPETAALAEALRTRTTSGLEPPATLVGRTPERSSIAQQASAIQRTSEPRETTPIARHGSTSRRGSLALLAVATAALVTAMVLVTRDRTAASADTAEGGGTHTRRLVLLPVEVARGDSSQRYVATGLARGLSRRLDRLGGLTIHLGTATAWPASPLQDTSALGRFGSVALLRVAIALEGDSLDVQAFVADSVTHVVRRVLTRRFAATALAEIESELAAVVVGSVLRVGTPFDPRGSSRLVEPESYRLTILGFHQLLGSDDPAAALASFVRATELDPLNARAWAGLSSVWAARTATDQVSLDEGVARTSAVAERALAIDSTDGVALANLGSVRALDGRNVAAGMPLIRRAIAFEPSNAEIFMIASGLNRIAHRWDEARDLIRLARQLDPLTPGHLEAEGRLEMCAGRPAASEQVYRHLLEQRPASEEAREGLVRALAGEGRFDAALDAWRLGISPTTPPVVVSALRGARGRDTYFAAHHAQGHLMLDAFRRARAGKRVSPLRLMLLQFQSGDSAAGFATLAAAARDRDQWIYRLPCFKELDEVRGTDHYRAMLTAIGPMPPR